VSFDAAGAEGTEFPVLFGTAAEQFFGSHRPIAGRKIAERHSRTLPVHR
jgi:hypothetical protein